MTSPITETATEEELFEVLLRVVEFYFISWDYDEYHNKSLIHPIWTDTPSSLLVYHSMNCPIKDGNMRTDIIGYMLRKCYIYKDIRDHKFRGYRLSDIGKEVFMVLLL